jgi:hypothetical protein
METNWEYLIEEFRSHRKESNEKLEKILVQTTKTNGRVDNLSRFQENAEIDLQFLKNAISENKGRDRIITIMIGALASIVGMVIAWCISKLGT